MLIDWFTVIAQAVNFLILVVLLKVFLFDRVVRAMDERQARIDAQLAEAERERREYEDKSRDMDRQRRELEERRAELLAAAERAAAERRDQLVDQARQEADRLRADWRGSLARDKERFLHGLMETIGLETGEVCRRVLADLADASLEARVLDVFLDRLAALDLDARRELAEAARRQGGVTVRTGRALDPAQERRVAQAVAAALNAAAPDGSSVAAAPVAFEVRPASLGASLQADGRRLAWDLDAYLERLLEAVGALLDEAAGNTAPEPEEAPHA